MTGLADCYLADAEPPRVRILDDLMRLILGGEGQKEGVGLTEYGIVVIDTDGTVTKNDTLKAAYAGGDRFVAPKNIRDCDLLDILDMREFAAYHDLQEPSSPVCHACPELNVCGGGMPAHRWSKENGYRNPTIFCADQRLLIRHLRNRLGVPVGSKNRTVSASHVAHV
jgi:uncharacterized protein